MLVMLVPFLFVKAGESVFFKVYGIAFTGTLAALILWILRYRNLFENFLVTISCMCFYSLFLFLGPATIERSLSFFIYFYAAENKTIQQDIFNGNEEYFQQFVSRRFEDGTKLGFLKCDETGTCSPTVKAVVLYKVFYPFGKITKTLYFYDNFKNTIDSRN